jgi:CheY-like chemotaxis protein
MVERILVVEDEARIASLISRTLRLEGYQVEVAPNGETALEKAISNPADLVVLDVMLPDIDGLEVCRQLRMAGCDEPVLMLTAKDAISDRVAGSNLSPSMSCWRASVPFCAGPPRPTPAFRCNLPTWNSIQPPARLGAASARSS